MNINMISFHLKRNKSLCLFLAFCLFSILIVCLSKNFFEYNDILSISGIVIILHYIIAISYLCYFEKMSFISLQFFFLSFLYLFNFGNIVINLFDSNYNFSVYDFLGHYDQTANIKAIQFAFLFINFIILGFILYNKFSNRKITNVLFNLKIFDIPNNQKFLKLLSLFIICTSFPIELYIVINKIIISLNQGYLATYDFYISGILVQIAQFYIIGFILLAFAYKNKKIIYNSIFLFLIIFQFVIMISGNRGNPVVSLCILFLIYFSYFYKLKIKSFFILCFFAFLGLFVVTGISKIRVNSYENIGALVESLFSIDNNPVISVFDEFGFTLYTLSLVMKQQPGPYGFTYGMTYLASFATILPNITSGLNSLVDFASFASHIGGGHIGGNLIAELFYNFSYFGVLLAIPLGYFISFLSNLAIDCLNKEKMYLFSFFILPSISVLWWVRDSFQNMPRMIVYSFIYLVVIKKGCDFFYNRGRKK